VDNWKDWWKMWSVRLLAVIVALQVVWETKPELVTALMPAEWVPRTTMALALVAAVSRVLKQTAVSSGPSQQQE
jgi:hypothetical protein